MSVYSDVLEHIDATWGKPGLGKLGEDYCVNVARLPAGRVWFPFDNNPCRVIVSGNVVEVRCYEHKGKAPPITRLDNDHYILNATGEVLEYDHVDHFGADRESLLNSFQHMRERVNATCTDPKKCKFITLTYAWDEGDAKAGDQRRPMTDTKRLYKDFQNFWESFKIWSASIGRGLSPDDFILDKNGKFTYPAGARRTNLNRCHKANWRCKCGNLGYIAAAEPQRPVKIEKIDVDTGEKVFIESPGSWHMHVILWWDDGMVAPYIPPDKLRELWGHGFVNIQSLAKPGPKEKNGPYNPHRSSGVDNIGAYLTWYLTNMTDSSECSGEYHRRADGSQQTRSHKYERLQYYPRNFHPFRFSRNCKNPVVTDCKWDDIEKKTGFCPDNKNPTYIKSYAIDIVDNNSGQVKAQNHVTSIYFNLLH